MLTRIVAERLRQSVGHIFGDQCDSTDHFRCYQDNIIRAFSISIKPNPQVKSRQNEQQKVTLVHGAYPDHLSNTDEIYRYIIKQINEIDKNAISLDPKVVIQWLLFRSSNYTLNQPSENKKKAGGAKEQKANKAEIDEFIGNIEAMIKNSPYAEEPDQEGKAPKKRSKKQAAKSSKPDTELFSKEMMPEDVLNMKEELSYEASEDRFIDDSDYDIDDEQMARLESYIMSLIGKEEDKEEVD